MSNSGDAHDPSVRCADTSPTRSVGEAGQPYLFGLIRNFSPVARLP